jgi:hypothetical protein
LSVHIHFADKGRKGEEVRDRTGRNTLDTTTTRKTTNSGLGDTLDVVAENLAVTLCAAFAEAFPAFAAYINIVSI